MKLVATLLVVLLGLGCTTKNRALAARLVENKCENSLRAVRHCTQVSVDVAEPECCKLLTTFKEMGCLSLCPSCTDTKNKEGLAWMLDLVPLAQACAHTAYVRAQASESIPHVLAALTKVAYRAAQEAGGVGKPGPSSAEEGKEGDLTKEERAHILDMLNQEGGELEGRKAAGDDSGWERGMSGGELQGGALMDEVSMEVEQDINDGEYEVMEDEMPLPWDAEEFKEPYPFKLGREQQPQTTVTREVSLDIAIDANAADVGRVVEAVLQKVAKSKEWGSVTTSSLPTAGASGLATQLAAPGLEAWRTVAGVKGVDGSGHRLAGGATGEGGVCSCSHVVVDKAVQGPLTWRLNTMRLMLCRTACRYQTAIFFVLAIELLAAAVWSALKFTRWALAPRSMQLLALADKQGWQQSLQQKGLDV